MGEYVGYTTVNGVTTVYAYATYSDYLAHHKYMEVGERVGALPVPTIEGYIFEGWFTYDDYLITENSFGVSDSMLYAKWRAISTHEHQYSSIVVEPGCTEQGYTVHTCSCGDSYIDSYVEAWGHSYSSQLIEGNCREPERVVHTCSQCGDVYVQYTTGTWSDWLLEKPEDIEETMIDYGTQYRYQTKQYITNTESFLEGWILYGTTSQWKYGPWSEWSDDAVSADMTIEVEMRTLYGYYYWLCSECGAHIPSILCKTSEGGCGGMAELLFGYEHLWADIAWEEAGLQQWHETNDYYTYIDGQLVFQSDSDDIKTQYRYRTKTEETVYCFFKWSDWSEWGDAIPEENDDINVETRSMYRYFVPQLGDHQYTDTVMQPSCTEQGFTTHICGHCGYSFVDSYRDALGHEYGEWYVVTDATCTEDGGCRHDCQRCDHFETEVIEATGHSLVHHEAKAPTCTEIGWDAYDTCENCDYSTYEEIPATGHSYNTVVTTPTCTEQGYTTHTCHCGDSYVDSYVEATGHHHEMVDSKEPTPTEDGYETWRCPDCGDEYTETVPATGETALWGDVNGDGTVNYMDAYLIMRYAVGQISSDDLDLTAADVSGDGNVNYMDAYLVMRYAVGQIEQFPVG